MTQSAADALKALSESERLPLGETIQLLLDHFQPTPHESTTDDWKVSVEVRLNDLEQQVKALSSEGKPKASRRVKVSENVDHDLANAVMKLHQSGVTGYQEIADQLTEQGYRNSRGNPYHRKQIARILSGVSS